uniref:Uncharacterized protein n=1 Tax=Globisporangium ultimum (strain ATCC 200006 / CBS 805.95 / DAOM BR144) TaxID=431595 RepID=K3WR23_GLOUD
PVLVETILNVPDVITDNVKQVITALLWSRHIGKALLVFQAHAVVLKLLNDALDWKPASYLH